MHHCIPEESREGEAHGPHDMSPFVTGCLFQCFPHLAGQKLLTFRVFYRERSQRNNPRNLVLPQQAIEGRNIGVQYFLQLF